jgi:hypothetical protein
MTSLMQDHLFMRWGFSRADNCHIMVNSNSCSGQSLVPGYVTPTAASL